MKDYIVLYYIKANRRQTAHTMRIEAKNASEACKEAKPSPRFGETIAGDTRR